MPEQQLLRQQMRARRAALSERDRRESADGLRRMLSTAPLFQQSRHIAFYMAGNGELDPHLLLEAAWEQQKKCYLPVLNSGGENHLFFAPYTRETKLIANRYGIPEPVHDARQHYPADRLDLVLVPLVAIDSIGNRVGMGKGYYDRTFAFMRRQPRPATPVLIGLAHRFQQVERLAANPWDVTLDGVADEQALKFFR